MSAGDSVKLDLFSKDTDLLLEEKYQHNKSCTSEQDTPQGHSTHLFSDSSFDSDEVHSEGKENKRRGLHVRFDMDENSNHSTGVTRDNTRSVKELRLIFDRDAKNIPSPPIMTSPRGTYHSGIDLRKYQKPSNRRNYRSNSGEVDYSPQYKGFNAMAGVDRDSNILSPDATLDSSTMSIDGSYNNGDSSVDPSLVGYSHSDSLLDGSAIGDNSERVEQDGDRSLLDGSTDAVGNGAGKNDPSVITEDMFAQLSEDLETGVDDFRGGHDKRSEHTSETIGELNGSEDGNGVEHETSHGTVTNDGAVVEEVVERSVHVREESCLPFEEWKSAFPYADESVDEDDSRQMHEDFNMEPAETDEGMSYLDEAYVVQDTHDSQQYEGPEVVEEVVVERVTKPEQSAIVFPDHMEEDDAKTDTGSYRDSGVGSYVDHDGLHGSAEVVPLLRGDDDSGDERHGQDEHGDEFSAKTLAMETDKSQLIEMFNGQNQEQTFPSAEIKKGNYVALDQPDNDLEKFEQCESPDSGLTDDGFKSGSGLVDNEASVGDDSEYISISEKDYICENRDSLKVITWLKPPPKEGLALPHTLHYPDGLQPGTCIYINGYPNEDAKSFHVTFQTEGDLPHTTVGLQMRPMFLKEDKFNSSSHVLCDSFVEGQWGEELRCCDSKLDMFPFTPGKQFLMRVVVKDECYQVTVDGNYALMFPHRVDPKEITHIRLDGDASFQILEVTDELELPYFVKIPRGMHVGKTIWIEAEPEPDAKRFHISFQCPAYSDIAIPFRMKILLGDGEQRVVCSSYCKGAWDEREYSASTTPFEANEKFLMKITVGDDSFKVVVNGLSFAEYPTVLPIHHVTHMEIDGDISLFSVNFHDKRDRKLSKGGCCNVFEMLFCCAV